MRVKLADSVLYTSDTGLHKLWLKAGYTESRTSSHLLSVQLSAFRLTSGMSFNDPIFILGDLNCNVLRPSEPEP